MRPSNLFSQFTEEEIGVSESLLDLGTVVEFPKPESSLRWGLKRRRSSVRASPLAGLRPYISPAAMSPSTSIQKSDGEIDRKLQVKGEAATSPSSPLCFVPSETDDKHTHSVRKNSKKRSRETYEKQLRELTETKNLLKEEIEHVRSYYYKLKAYNLELKARREKASNPRPKQDSKMDLTQHYRVPIMPLPHHQQQPLITQQMGFGSRIGEKFQYPCGPIAPMFTTNGVVAGVTPVGPAHHHLDLNLNVSPQDEEEEGPCGVEAPQPLDLDRLVAERKARCAEARMIRKRLIQMKAMKSGVSAPRCR